MSKNKVFPLDNNNTWTNEYGDFITRGGSFYDKKGVVSSFTITIDGQYLKSVGGLSVAKSIVNSHRGCKCKWIGSHE